MKFARLLTVAVLIPITGCHSAYIEATVHNGTGETLSPVELDYPSASFGIPTLGPNQDFHYRFKTQGSGETRLIYTDSRHADHTVVGPVLHEGDEGRLSIIIENPGVKWYRALTTGSASLPAVNLGKPKS